MFGNDNFGFAGVGIVLITVVDFIAVDKHHDIGVLLQGAGFPQIRQLGAFVGSLFELAVELGQGHHGHVQLFGQGFQGP